RQSRRRATKRAFHAARRPNRGVGFSQSSLILVLMASKPAFAYILDVSLEGSFHETIEIAIQYRLRISYFNSCTQVLDSGLIQYIVSDLAAPADIRLFRLRLLLLAPAFGQLQLVE